MIKKLLGLLLSAVVALSVCTGCTIIETDEEARMAQPVAIIEPITIDLGNGQTHVTERRTVTKHELNNYFLSLAQQYLSYYSAQELYDIAFDNLVNRQLLLIEVEKEKLVGHIAKEPTQAQANDAWKEVYAQLDQLIYERMAVIAKDYDLEAPSAPQTGTDSEPTYALREEEAADTEEVIEAEWYPAYKAVNYTVENGEKILTDEDKLWLQATRDIIGNIIDLVDVQSFLLTDSEKEKLEADKAKFKDVKSILLTDDRIAGLDEDDSTAVALGGYFDGEGAYVATGPVADAADVKGIYASMMDYFCIEYAFFNNYRDSIDIENLEKYVTKDVVVTPAQVAAEYNRLLANQTASYGTAADATDTQKSNFTSALDADGGELLLYRPHDVKQYYVKHILVPFTDEQIAKFSSTSTDVSVQDKTAEQLKSIRASIATQITGYAHADGYDVTDRTYTIDEIRTDIAEYMKNSAGNATLADERFTDLIFKWNTDPGIFNNAVGYGLRYGEKSSYMQEFEDASNKLYEKYMELGTAAIGMIEECVTDYGIHFIMLSSVLGTSTLGLDSAVDVTGKTTVREHIYDTLKTTAETNEFTAYQQTLVNAMTHKWGKSIKKYPSRYADLVKLYEQE